MGRAARPRDMVRKTYIPDRGDAVWISFDPSLGREQAKRRPAVVLTPRSYNERTGLALACPITIHTKGYPFEVGLRERKIKGVVLCDHVKSMDWRMRRTIFIQKISPVCLTAIQNKIVRLFTEE